MPTKAYRLPSEWIQPNSTVVNVASFKNVDEEAILKIPGVVYIPLVGKVTVAMLERNLVRLFDQFHHPLRQNTNTNSNNTSPAPWYGSWINLYTAAAITAMLYMQVTARK